MDAFTTAVLVGLVGSHGLLWYKIGSIEKGQKRLEQALNTKP